jgi:hypothetical protein
VPARIVILQRSTARVMRDMPTATGRRVALGTTRHRVRHSGLVARLAPGR